jgi:biopolymer transport protein ExbD
MRRSAKSRPRCHTSLGLHRFSIVFAALLLMALLGICRILPTTRLAGPMVTLPAFANQSSTTRPQGHAIVITYTGNNKIYLNNEIVTFEQLPQKLFLLKNANANAPVYLKIDRRVPYGMAITIWHFARTQRVELVSLVVSGQDSFDQRIMQLKFGTPDWLRIPVVVSTQIGEVGH